MSATVLRRSLALQFEREGELMRWVDRARPDAPERADLFGQPGLWRRVRRGPRIVRIFECPVPTTLPATDDEPAGREDRTRLLSGIRDWMAATSRGQLPPDWGAPPAEEIEAWLAPERLVVRAGAHVAKGDLECDAGRLRLRFPDLVRFPPDLPEGRRAWLSELCLDAQSRWQLVRFVVSDERVKAEVDLSGVPRALAHPLFARAVEALVFSVEWALPALALVSDPSVESRMLDQGPWWLREDPKQATPVNPARSAAIAGAPSAHRTSRTAARARSIEE